ncbi:MAG TPA: oxidoreductase [Nevskiaceae bacterium]|nr:oxidoreductase [Nevskiaceae bacterium]
MAWTPESAGSQKGRTFVITGANTGLGFENARTVAKLGGRVVLACRNGAKAEDAAARIRADVPGADVRVSLVDVSSLASVRAFAARTLAELDRIDVLINNAGVMVPPREITQEGFELQFVTNYAGHFLLTGLLLDRIVATPGSRIVTLSSLAHWTGKVDLENLNAEKSYSRWGHYAASKLQCLIFARELQRCFDERKIGTRSLASHPGGSVTELARHSAVLHALERFVQTAYEGSLPTMRAALDPQARGGEYYGPRFEIGGVPVRSHSSRLSKDAGVARRLWEQTERLTGIQYP